MSLTEPLVCPRCGNKKSHYGVLCQPCATRMWDLKHVEAWKHRVAQFSKRGGDAAAEKRRATKIRVTLPRV